MGNRLLYAVLLLAVICGVPSNTDAQIVYGSPAAGGIGVDFTSWTIDSADGEKAVIYQIIMPIYGFVPLRDNLEMTIYLANSANFLDTPADDYNLSGLNNASVQVSQSLGEDHFLLSFGLNLPTGKRKLNYEEEAEVLNVLTQNFLQMPMTRFGEGFGFNLLAGGATMLGENVRAGAGVTYQYTGSYEPYENYTDYNPGDLVGINVGLDMGTDSARSALDVVYTLYTNDTHDGANVFRQAPQIDFRLSGFRSNGAVTLSGLLRYLNRGDNKEFDGTGTELAPLRLYGNEFGAAGGVSFKLGNQFFAGPSAEYRSVSSSDVSGSSSVFGVGANFSAGAGQSVAITGGGKYHFGDADGGNIDITGYSASLGLTARF
jgi:hypothetical protein